MHTVFARPSTAPETRSADLVAAIYEVADLVRARTVKGLGGPLLSGEVCPFDSRYRVSVQVAYGPAVRSYLSDEVAYLSDAPAATLRLLEAILCTVACDLARVLGGGSVVLPEEKPKA